MIQLGEKIKTLRRQRGISQEILASALGVGFQAVSKWETGTTLPDVAMIPAIASFFGVSTDELFSFNLMEQEKQVQQLCLDAYAYRVSDPAKSEQMLREGLKRFPGNDIVLNNLLYTLDYETRADEVIEICCALVETTKLDDVKYDALRILAETYKAKGEYELCKQTIARIPEFYFSKLELDAELLEGDDMFEAAHRQKNLSADTLVNMLMRLHGYYHALGEEEAARKQLQIAKEVIEAFREDILPPFFKQSFFEDMQETRQELVTLLKE